jgi:hypothetical protein
MIMYSHSDPSQNPSIKSSPRKSRSRAGSHHANLVSNVWCMVSYTETPISPPPNRPKSRIGPFLAAPVFASICRQPPGV